jgi:hypothetical protein
MDGRNDGQSDTLKVGVSFHSWSDFLKEHKNIIDIFISCRSQWPCGLRRGSWPVGCWDRGFESRSRRECLSLVFLCCVVLCR